MSYLFKQTLFFMAIIKLIEVTVVHLQWHFWDTKYYEKKTTHSKLQDLEYIFVYISLCYSISLLTSVIFHS